MKRFIAFVLVLLALVATRGETVKEGKQECKCAEGEEHCPCMAQAEEAASESGSAFIITNTQ